MKTATRHPHTARSAKQPVALDRTRISDQLSEAEDDLFEVLGSLRMINGLAGEDGSRMSLEPMETLAFFRLLDRRLTDVHERVQEVNRQVDDPPKPAAVA